MFSKPPSRKSALKNPDKPKSTTTVHQDNKKRKLVKESPSSVLQTKDANVYVSKTPSPVVHKRRVSFCDTLTLTQKEDKPTFGLLNFDDEKENIIHQDLIATETKPVSDIVPNFIPVQSAPTLSSLNVASVDDDNMSIISADESLSSDSIDESVSESDASSSHDPSDFPDYDEEMSFTGAFGKILFEAKKKSITPITDKTIVFSSPSEDEENMEMTAVFGKISIQTPEELISQLEEHTSHSLIEDMEQERLNSLNSSLEPQYSVELNSIKEMKTDPEESIKIIQDDHITAVEDPRNSSDSLNHSPVAERIEDQSSKKSKLLTNLRRLSMPLLAPQQQVKDSQDKPITSVEETNKRRRTISQSIRQLATMYGPNSESTSTVPLSHQALLKHNSVNTEDTFTMHSNMSLEFTNTSLNSLREAYTPKRRISELKKFASFTPGIQQEELSNPLPQKLETAKTEAISPYYPITVNEFLNRCNIRFVVEELSSSRRIGVCEAAKPLINYDKATALLMNVPLFKVMDKYADELEHRNNILQNKIEKLDSDLSMKNPAIFKYIQTLPKEELASFAKKLSKLKQKANLKSKLMQYDWKIKYEHTLTDTLRSKLGLLSGDIHMLNEHQQYLNSLKQQIFAEIESTKHNISHIQLEKVRIQEEQLEKEKLKKEELAKISESEAVSNLVAKLRTLPNVVSQFYSFSHISDEEIVVHFDKLETTVSISLDQGQYCCNCKLKQHSKVVTDPAKVVRDYLVRTAAAKLVSTLNGIALPLLFIHFSSIVSCMYRIYLLYQELTQILSLKRSIILEPSEDSKYAIRFVDLKNRSYSFTVCLTFSNHYPFDDWKPFVQFYSGTESLQTLIQQTIQNIPYQWNRSVQLVSHILEAITTTSLK